MATEVKLPRLGQGMESGTIVRWLKAEGDAVRKREPLYELDTDKVTQEVESDFDGVLLKIVVAEGEVEVGSTIAMIERRRRRCRGSAARWCGRRRKRAPAPADADGSGSAAEASPAGGDGTASASAARAGTRRGSRHRPWRGGSRASAGSTWRRWRAPARTAASSPRTSSAPPSAAPRQPVTAPGPVG